MRDLAYVSALDLADAIRRREVSSREALEVFLARIALLDKAINSVLDEKQQKRLHQIVLQQQGIGALQQEDVQKALKLSDEQKEKIKDIQGDLQKEMQGLFQPGEKPDFQAMQKKMEGLRKEAMTNATKVLNDDQKKTFKDLTGEPLELKPEDFPQGFGRGGRGGKPDKPRTDF